MFSKISEAKTSNDEETVKTSSPRRFCANEMMMLENLVAMPHSQSLLITCRMIISTDAYPPPDLLYLLMKKYLLVC